MPVSTILVVDDTPEVLDLTVSILEEAGHAVLRCSGAREALAVLKDGHAIDLLLTDIVMPGEIDGFELARQAQVTRPAMPVAYLSGEVQTQPDGHEVLGPILRKPYRRADLVQEVQKLLAAAEDARLLQVVALELMQRYPDAFERVNRAEESDCIKGDELSAQAWHDISEAIAAIHKPDPEG